MKMTIKEAEAKKEFHFVPDSMCLNPREFTEVLCRYAEENRLDMVITKEGMYPEFVINGVEYEADRVFGRFGAVVRCRMKYPEEAEPLDVPQKRYRLLKWFRTFWVLILLAVVLVASRMQKISDLIFLIPMALVLFILVHWTYGGRFTK